MKVMVGGTFDPLHDGHKRLIARSFELAGIRGSVTIGLTTDLFASRKSHPVRPFSERRASLEDFITKCRFLAAWSIEPLNDRYGSAIDTEFDALFCLDSKESGFELMPSVLVARAIDYAKLGRLFLNNGNWNGKQLIPSGWIVASTAPYFPEDKNYYPDKTFFKEYSGYYSLMWWGIQREDTSYDFYAAGNHGQYIYVSPEKNLIIVRNGISYGKDIDSENINWWPIVLYQFANQFPSE